MTSDGGGEWIPFPSEGDDRLRPSAEPPERLDSLLPTDPDTGVANCHAFHVYLGGILDLMARHGQPLTLLLIAPDSSDNLRLLGANGARLLGPAIARCLRQETRAYDVIGYAKGLEANSPPAFLLALPMIAEALAKPFAERLREAMTISTIEEGRPWLTLSVGIASLSLETDAPETLILRAQEALASAQRCGGDRVWSHSDTVRRIIDRDRPDTLQE